MILFPDSPEFFHFCLLPAPQFPPKSGRIFRIRNHWNLDTTFLTVKATGKGVASEREESVAPEREQRVAPKRGAST